MLFAFSILLLLVVVIKKKYFLNDIIIILWVLSTFFVYGFSTFIANSFFAEYLNTNKDVEIIRYKLLIVFELAVIAYMFLTSFFPHKKYEFAYFKNHSFSHQFYIYFLIFFTLIYIFFGGLSARTIYGNDIEIQSAFYYVRAFFDILFLSVFYIVISKNKYAVLFTFILILLMSLGGHRAYILSFLICYIVAKYFISTEKIKLQYLIYTVLVLFALNYVTSTRFSQNQFADINFLTLDRLYEPTIDRIIQYDIKTAKKFSFENFDRISTIMIPSFLLPSKKNNDDKDEVLKKYYGLDISDRSHWPLPGTVDSFRRFGYSGVFFFTFLLCFLINFWINFSLNNKNYLLLFPFLLAFSYRFFSFSVLGSIAFFSYNTIKMVIIIYFINLLKNLSWKKS